MPIEYLVTFLTFYLMTLLGVQTGTHRWKVDQDVGYVTCWRSSMTKLGMRSSGGWYAILPACSARRWKIWQRQRQTSSCVRNSWLLVCLRSHERKSSPGRHFYDHTSSLLRFFIIQWCDSCETVHYICYTRSHTHIAVCYSSRISGFFYYLCRQSCE